MATTEELFYYQKNHLPDCTEKKCAPGCHVETLEEALPKAIQCFVKKRGHYPEYVVINVDDYKKGKYKLRLVASKVGCPPSHFILGPVIIRQARRIFIQRVSYI